MAITAESTQIFRRVIQPESGTLAAELAQFVHSLDFRPDDHARYEQLSSKAREGSLTSVEEDELDGCLHVDSLLSILRLKADRSLRI
jgi:hypothetical protein